MHRTIAVTGSKYARRDEDMMFSLEREVPAFGGFFLDERRNIVAYVSDTGKEDLVRAALSRHLATDRLGLPASYAVGSILVRKGDFSFQELSDIRDSVTALCLGKVSGVVYDDVDEAINRVTIGVVSSGSQATISEVTAILQKIGINFAAIYFALTSRLTRPSLAYHGRSASRSPLSVTYLDSLADTIAAGFQTSASNNSDRCSIGLVLDRNSTRYATIASHCFASHQFSLDTTQLLYQAWGGNGDHSIGHEAWDTNSTRHADIALYKLNAGIVSIRGAIARSWPRDSGASNSRQLTTGGGSSFIYFFASATPVVGVEVNKIGRTTGWTYGTITATCADVTVNGVTIHCQMKTSVWTGSGDSGSSAWAWDGADGATLYGVSLTAGVVTGTETIDGATTFVGDTTFFSTYANFTTDIGTSGLSVLISTSVGSFSPSGTISSGNPVPGWTTPTISNPTGATTYYRIYRATFSGGVTTEPEELISTVQSTNSYLDLTRTATSYNGTSSPGIHNNWVSYRVEAYNSGVTQTASTVYFITP